MSRTAESRPRHSGEPPRFQDSGCGTPMKAADQRRIAGRGWLELRGASGYRTVFEVTAGAQRPVGHGATRFLCASHKFRPKTKDLSAVFCALAQNCPSPQAAGGLQRASGGAGCRPAGRRGDDAAAHDGDGLRKGTGRSARLAGEVPIAIVGGSAVPKRTGVSGGGIRRCSGSPAIWVAGFRFRQPENGRNDTGTLWRSPCPRGTAAVLAAKMLPGSARMADVAGDGLGLNGLAGAAQNLRCAARSHLWRGPLVVRPAQDPLK